MAKLNISKTAKTLGFYKQVFENTENLRNSLSVKFS